MIEIRCHHGHPIRITLSLPGQLPVAQPGQVTTREPLCRASPASLGGSVPQPAVAVSQPSLPKRLGRSAAVSRRSLRGPYVCGLSPLAGWTGRRSEPGGPIVVRADPDAGPVTSRASAGRLTVVVTVGRHTCPRSPAHRGRPGGVVRAGRVWAHAYTIVVRVVTGRDFDGRDGRARVHLGGHPGLRVRHRAAGVGSGAGSTPQMRQPAPCTESPATLGPPAWARAFRDGSAMVPAGRVPRLPR